MKKISLIFLLTIFSINTLVSQTKCLHFHNNDIKKNNDRVLDNTVTFDPETGRPYFDKILTSEYQRFNIHYFEEGINAPDTIDSDNNGHPDYIDSVAYYCEEAYRIEIEEMGFRSPIPEPRGGSDAYDIYIFDLGNSLGTYGFNYPDSAIKSSNNFPQFYSFVVIDNDFSKTDSIGPANFKRKTFYTTGFEALKVTIAHEFHHAVQNMYGIDNATALTFMEATSVMMEHLLYPDIPDYIQYVNQLFKFPDIMPFGYVGGSNNLGPYAYSLFLIYLVEKYDYLIIRELWENVYAGHNNFYALNLALESRDFSMDEAWCEFKEWCYYTGSRTKEGNYFEYAKDYPEMAFYKDEVFSPPSMNSASKMEAYEMRYYRCIFDNIGNVSDDTLDVILGSLDLESARRNAGYDINYSLVISDMQIPNSHQLEDMPYFFFLEHENNKMCHQLILNKGSANVTIQDAYPNPFRSLEHESIYFPAPEQAKLFDKATLTLYTSDMMAIYQEELEVGSHNNHYIVPLHRLPDKIESGVHIFSVKHGDEVILGKIAIILN